MARKAPCSAATPPAARSISSRRCRSRASSRASSMSRRGTMPILASRLPSTCRSRTPLRCAWPAIDSPATATSRIWPSARPTSPADASPASTAMSMAATFLRCEARCHGRSRTAPVRGCSSTCSTRTTIGFASATRSACATPSPPTAAWRTASASTPRTSAPPRRASSPAAWERCRSARMAARRRCSTSRVLTSRASARCTRTLIPCSRSATTSSPGASTTTSAN